MFQFQHNVILSKRDPPFLLQYRKWCICTILHHETVGVLSYGTCVQLQYLYLYVGHLWIVLRVYRD
jgi:hypothetical protein